VPERIPVFPVRKEFDGKPFRLLAKFSSKESADEQASFERYRGYKVRVWRKQGWFGVYTSPGVSGGY